MSLERYLSATIRHQIEQQYYAKVNAQARLEQLLRDPDFCTMAEKHVGLYSDHGVVHARDVAQQILDVLERVHGILIPHRNAARFQRMKGYGVLLAYLHDVGMFDFSAFGRAMHPEFAAQVLFRPEMDTLIATIWQENSSGLPTLLTDLAAQGILPARPQTVLRELLAMALCHSKSKAPVALLNDRIQLRTLLLTTLYTDLATLYTRQRDAQQPDTRQRVGHQPTVLTGEGIYSGGAADGSSAPLDLQRHYDQFAEQAFGWLTATDPSLRLLADDVIDTVRALRCADALRQRGTVLRTSGGYEIFMDQQSAHAIFALRLDDSRLFFLESIDQISAGEANIASSELDPACDLRISFHRGRFTAPGAIEYAVASAARVVQDIQSDVIESFCRSPTAADVHLKGMQAIQIFLEETDDNRDFAELVRQQLLLHYQIQATIQVAPSLQQATELERARYLAASWLDWNRAQRQTLIAQLTAAGCQMEDIDLEQAFAHVKPIHLTSGDVLLEAGAPAAFVYIPLDPGLKIFPLGGYGAVTAQPWLPLGVAGVIRGATRNATITAEQPVRLLMIPKMTYLQHWYRPHSLPSLLAAVSELTPT